MTRLDQLQSRLRSLAGAGLERLDSRLWIIDWLASGARSVVDVQATAAVACGSLGEAFLLATEEHPADSPQELHVIEARPTFHLALVPSAADWATLMKWLTPQAWLGLVFASADGRPGELEWETGRVFASPRSALALVEALGARAIIVPYYDNDSWIVGVAAEAEGGLDSRA